MKKLSLIFLTFSILLFSCQEQYDKETKLFNSYLQKNFNKQLVDKKQIYFIIPAISCSGCKEFLLNKLKTLDFKANLIITYDNDYLPNNILKLIDTKKNIDRLNIPISSTYVVVSKNKKITNIVEITPNNYSDVYQMLKNEKN